MLILLFVKPVLFYPETEGRKFMTKSDLNQSQSIISTGPLLFDLSFLFLLLLPPTSQNTAEFCVSFLQFIAFSHSIASTYGYPTAISWRALDLGRRYLVCLRGPSSHRCQGSQIWGIRGRAVSERARDLSNILASPAMSLYCAVFFVLAQRHLSRVHERCGPLLIVNVIY